MNAAQSNLNLGVIGNCQIAALIDEHASIVWCCLPRPDGDPVFSALLSDNAAGVSRGAFSVELLRTAAREQRYVHNTAIIETLLHDDQGGSVRITDFSPRFRSRGRMFRPMTLIRLVEPIAGRPIVRFLLQPTSGYGAHVARGVAASHHVRFSGSGVDYRLTTDASLSALLEAQASVLEQPVTFILGPDETIEQAPAVLARGFLDETRQYWQDWVRTLAIPFDWQREVIRAAITLKLCTYEDTGAVLAALTTSIPECPGSQRNWDYRYCWLRDSYFVIQALNRLGATRTMEAYLHFIDHIVARSSVGELQPLYGISGDPQAEERTVSTLPGYRGIGPVRVGNSAATQNQHDVYGAVILATTQLYFDERLVSAGDAALFERLERLGDRATSVYELPDAGPWEFRGRQQTHTFSAAMSWAGCDRLARIGARIGRVASAARWRNAADGMRERIVTRSWSERRQAFVAAFGGDDLDATVLLLPELGLISPHDPRFHHTVRTIGRELRSGDLLYRYRHADDFGHPETAFAVCGFWYVNALAAIGEVEQARELFSRLLARCNPLGLLSEDIHPETGELWGNFPQTYSMVGIINSALRLSTSWETAL